MTSTKITDEMVERAVDAFSKAWPPGTTHGAMLSALTAALNPPPEPEIEVTEGMRRAGTKIYMGDDPETRASWDLVTAIYRAMESTRLKEAQSGAAYAAKDAAKPSVTLGTVHGLTVAVGFPTNRTDGMTSLHIDGTVLLLDDTERAALVSLLQRPSALRRDPHQQFWDKFYGMSRD